VARTTFMSTMSVFLRLLVVELQASMHQTDLITLTFDLSTSKWGYGSPVSWASFLPIFNLLRLHVLDLG